MLRLKAKNEEKTGENSASSIIPKSSALSVATSHRHDGRKRRHVILSFGAALAVTLLFVLSGSTSSRSVLFGKHKTVHEESSASSSSSRNVITNYWSQQTPSSPPPIKKDLHIAFVGNSIIFFNDGHKLLRNMLTAKGYNVTYNACMEGGATLISLWKGCSSSFVTGNRRVRVTLEKLLSPPLDFVILNDQTRSPALAVSRAQTKAFLLRKYAPRLYEAKATPVFLHTAAYRTDLPMMGSFDQFTANLQEGYQEYAHLLTDYFASQNDEGQQQPQKALVAPFGMAVANVRQQHPELWKNLYLDDDMHPSPLGTWLEACVLFCTMLPGEEPPIHTPNFWKGIRLNSPIPTQEEAQILWDESLRITTTGSRNGNDESNAPANEVYQ